MKCGASLISTQLVLQCNNDNSNKLNKLPKRGHLQWQGINFSKVRNKQKVKQFLDEWHYFCSHISPFSCGQQYIDHFTVLFQPGTGSRSRGALFTTLLKLLSSGYQCKNVLQPCDLPIQNPKKSVHLVFQIRDLSFSFFPLLSLTVHLGWTQGRCKQHFHVIGDINILLFIQY